MKKEYLTPNLLEVDLVAACMQDPLFPIGTSQTDEQVGGGMNGLPARRTGPAPL